MAGLGALVPNPKEGSQATLVVIFPLIIPLFFSNLVATAPNAPIFVFFSLFPADLAHLDGFAHVRRRGARLASGPVHLPAVDRHRLHHPLRSAYLPRPGSAGRQALQGAGLRQGISDQIKPF